MRLLSQTIVGNFLITYTLVSITFNKSFCCDFYNYCLYCVIFIDSQSQNDEKGKVKADLTQSTAYQETGEA